MFDPHTGFCTIKVGSTHSTQVFFMIKSSILVPINMQRSTLRTVHHSAHQLTHRTALVLKHGGNFTPLTPLQRSGATLHVKDTGPDSAESGQEWPPSGMEAQHPQWRAQAGSWSEQASRWVQAWALQRALGLVEALTRTQAWQCRGVPPSFQDVRWATPARGLRVCAAPCGSGWCQRRHHRSQCRGTSTPCCWVVAP